MSTALATAPTQQAPRRSALITMAMRLNVEEGPLLKTLKDTVCKGCSDSEVMAFAVVANEYKLNPFIKEIYAFPAKGGGIVPVVSIDGWVSMVNDHPQMDGVEFDYIRSEGGALEGITCSIWRKDRTRPIVVTEWLSECKRNTEPWKMENRMLRHKALMQCARYAFGFSGISDDDEAEDMRAVQGRVIDEAPVNPYRERRAIGAPAPAAEDSPPFEAHAEPAPPTDAERKDAALDKIDNALAGDFEEPITRAQFESMLRGQKLLGTTSTLMGVKLDRLENIAASVHEIVAEARKGAE